MPPGGQLNREAVHIRQLKDALAALSTQLIYCRISKPLDHHSCGLMRLISFANFTSVQSTNFVRLLLVIRETERDSDNGVHQCAGFDSDLSWSETSNWFLQTCSVASFAVGQTAMFGKLKGVDRCHQVFARCMLAEILYLK
jgi:hypothetical protein